MSYVAPIYLEEILHDTKLMGFVFASSSVFGILADLLLGSLLRKRNYIFFLAGSGILGLAFPILFLLLPPTIFVMVLAMAVWGIYYEMIRFGKFKFIPRFFKKEEHALSWGLITVFSALAVTVSPLVASHILEGGYEKVFKFSIPFYLFSLIIVLLFYFLANKRKSVEIPVVSIGTKDYKKLLDSFQSWKIFLKSIWLILLFIFVISVIDASFWTIGTILSEELKGYGGGLLLFLYSFPSLFVGLFTAKFGRPFGKKRAAFASGLICGVLMALMGVSSEPRLLLFLTFLSSFFVSISWPEITAVMEDFVARVGKASSDLVGVQGLSINMGYVLGPIFAGIIADMTGIRQTFSIFGAGLAIVSLLSLFIVPRKVRLPEKELKEIGQG